MAAVAASLNSFINFPTTGLYTGNISSTITQTGSNNFYSSSQNAYTQFVNETINHNSKYNFIEYLFI